MGFFKKKRGGGGKPSGAKGHGKPMASKHSKLTSHGFLGTVKMDPMTPITKRVKKGRGTKLK